MLEGLAEVVSGPLLDNCDVCSLYVLVGFTYVACGPIISNRGG